jgi:hypothetical protein
VLDVPGSDGEQPARAIHVTPENIMRYVPIPALLLAAACASDGNAPEPGAELPPDMRIEGYAAEVHADGSSVTCSFSLTVIWDAAERSGREVTYTGQMGGETQRQVLDAEGSGRAFFADMAWPTAQVRIIDGDSVSMNLSAGGEPSGSPFWDAFRAINGRKRDGQWSGPWTCLPMTGPEGSGHPDTTGTAVGSWQLTAPFVQRP